MNVIQLKSEEELEKTLLGKGILTIWVDWSIGFLNCKKLIQYLEENNSKETVYVINTDLISRENWEKFFGVLLHGWGEIFVFDKGKILSAYTGKESFEEFKKNFHH